MKVSREQAEENRERIIEAASRLFRERGFDGIGVADVMKDAGLTHGGFYGHFESKEDLIAQAVTRALSNSVQTWARVIDEATGDPLQALAARYLSIRHRDAAGRGCLFAALGPEVSRQGMSIRHSVTEGLQSFIDTLAGILPGRTKTARQSKALAIYASLVGGMVLARAVDDPALSKEILDATAASLPKAKRRKRPIDHKSRRGTASLTGKKELKINGLG